MTEEISEVRGVLGKYWDLFLYFVIWFFLFIQLTHMAVDPSFDPKFISFYTNTILAGLVVIMGMGLFRWRYGDVLTLPTWAKLIWIVIWVIMIGWITIKQGQIIGVPDSMVLGASLSKESQIYNSAVFPAFGEDMVWLVGLPMGLSFIFFLIVEKIGFEIGWGMFITLGVIACVISAFVFTSAHVHTYQEQRIAYTGAFVFATGQSITYLFTGVLIPFAHAIHNYLVKFNQLYQINIFGYSIVGGSE
jgi:hypothetical protein